MVRKVKLIIEKHPDGYLGYPLGLRDGVAVVGQGDTYEQALADVTSAIKFALESSSEAEIFDAELPVGEVFVAEIEVPVSAYTIDQPEQDPDPSESCSDQIFHIATGLQTGRDFPR